MVSFGICIVLVLFSLMRQTADFTCLMQRIVVGEALKLSRISVEKLLEVLLEAHSDPDWENMVLPHGKI